MDVFPPGAGVGHQNFEIVSFYTPDYEPFAEGLIQSIRRTMPRVRYDIEGITQREWKDATCFKGEFIHAKLCASDKPLLWIDADAIVERAFKMPDVDFAIYARFSDPLRRVMSPFRTGTMYFGQTRLAKRLAAAYRSACKTIERGIDQWALWRAWLSEMGHADTMPSTVFLPREYCQKKDEKGEAMIKHLMASRTHKQKR